MRQQQAQASPVRLGAEGGASGQAACVIVQAASPVWNFQLQLPAVDRYMQGYARPPGGNAGIGGVVQKIEKGLGQPRLGLNELLKPPCDALFERYFGTQESPAVQHLLNKIADGNGLAGLDARMAGIFENRWQAGLALFDLRFEQGEVFLRFRKVLQICSQLPGHQLNRG